MADYFWTMLDSLKGWPRHSHIGQTCLDEEMQMSLSATMSHKASCSLLNKRAKWCCLLINTSHCEHVFLNFWEYLYFWLMGHIKIQSQQSHTEPRRNGARQVFCNGSLIVMGRGLPWALRAFFCVIPLNFNDVKCMSCVKRGWSAKGIIWRICWNLAFLYTLRQDQKQQETPCCSII